MGSAAQGFLVGSCHVFNESASSSSSSSSSVFGKNQFFLESSNSCARLNLASYYCLATGSDF